MKRIFVPFFVLFAGLIVFVSCLGDGEDYIYYDDTAITSFTLGTLNQTVDTTTSAGKDSTYTTTVDCSGYTFYIDQQRREVYNPDSLPYGIDSSKVVCTISSKNSGYIIIKNIDSDTLKYYSSSDSIDFSVPRTFYVYSSLGTSRREYTVRVNIHKEKPNVMKWSNVGKNISFPSLTDMRAVSLENKLFVFGTNGSSTLAFSSSDGSTWQSLTYNFGRLLGTDAYKSVVKKNGYLYIYDSGEVMRSTNGNSWETVSQATLRQLVAASDTRLYAYDADGQFVVSEDDGETWSAAELDDSSDNLPTEDLNYVSIPSVTNDDTYRLLIVGNRDSNTYASDTIAHVWGKTEETSQHSQNQSWVYYKVAANNRYKLPRLRNIQTTTYDDCVIAVGEESLAGTTHTPFDRIYCSYDEGITWKRHGVLTIPDGFDTTTTAYAIASDDNNYLWLICGKDGSVWRGRINRLGWTTDKTAFTE